MLAFIEIYTKVGLKKNMLKGIRDVEKLFKIRNH